MDVLAKKENGSVPNAQEAETVWCASNCEDNSFAVDRATGEQVVNMGGSTNDVDVNITEVVTSDGNWLHEVKCDDETECSSSFADTFSEPSCDNEVESQPLLKLGGFGMTCRTSKKHVTNQWRRFVRPLMSCCRRLELQIDQIKAINSKYGTEIAKNDQRKQCEFGNFADDNCCVKSVPFCSHTRNKMLRRTKRKRVEDTADVASYVSQHNVFSYFEKRRNVTNGASLLDFNNLGNLGCKTMNGKEDFILDDEVYPIDIQNNFDSAEQILRKIEVAKSRVCELKSRVDTVVHENPTKFSSINMLSYLAPRKVLTASRNPASPGNGDGLMHVSMRTSSLHLSRHSNSGNMVKPEIDVSSDEEVASRPGTIANIKQLQHGGSSTKLDDDFYINDQTANKESLHIESSGNIQSNQLPRVEGCISVVQDDKLPPGTTTHGATSHGGKKSMKPEVHVASRRKRRRRRQRWGF